MTKELYLFLDLSAQNLTCVPEQVAKCTALQKLNLSNNKIQRLPRFLENLQNLEARTLFSNTSYPFYMIKKML